MTQSIAEPAANSADALQQQPHSLLTEVSLGQYRFTATQLLPGTVLDIACGSGDGMALLKTENPNLRQMTGVDLSPDAIETARNRHPEEHFTFLQADGAKYWDTNGFANVVSLGTLEHIADPASFIRRLAALLRTGGIFVVSAPVTPSTDSNAHHLSDFTEDSLRLYCKSCDLEEIEAYEQTQGFDPRSMGTGGSAGKHGLFSFYKKNPDTLLSRIASTLRHGFQHRYLTISWRKPF